ncbi:NTPase [Vibrio parahaemolyticus]|uniref:KAP family P-loop NTPase fold protein n=2 Tax=Vibrio parahaemolyticus TaxID=670 RepID=UPI0009F0009A|nr:P-loop NTPase fold protein [Vibrio parahaemolyticus]EGQ8103621.1 NTPase [Vibrio parahaemolyticus]EGQ8107741.1 NTPase [Vibrio parahaemolyticus]EGQ8404848.1 NTPase [Vibrio parahaemolyticus]EGR1581252.1 NTPase [Vibrio parahaemolyticus]EGR2300103.1 NTPase [Vibrio parahaemolyticus]
MEPKDLHGFASDRPITRVEEDLLGRSGFSTDLANAMASWHGKDSLVVALHGDWGAGKSSIKNMALSRLEEISEDKPDVIEFSPWEWAAQDKITASFFQEISKSIGRTDKSKSGKKLAATLKKYGLYLNTGETLVTGFSAALPTLFVLATLIGVSGNFSDEAWVKNASASMLIALGGWAAALKWGKTFLDRLTGNIEATVKANEQSLSDIRQDLSGLLLERKAPLIVVMDDLDRLTTSQLRMVFQLIKANLEFPNVVFLLLFQRDLVEDKLNDGAQLGRDYLEKIIQVPFDIPRIETTRLHSLLFNKLDKIIEQDASATKMFDSGRWGNIFHGSLNTYFDNLRSVYRYTSTLSFHFTLLKGKSAFEVNPVDLIAIECLRVFEPDVYKEIARSKEIFTKNGSDRYGGRADATADFINRILDKASPDKRDSVKEMVEQLFPTIQWALGGTHYSGDFFSTWLREMRVCHPSNFDKYFQFSIPSGELSNSDLQEMLSLTADSDRFSSFILSLKDRGILKNALSQFESFTDDIPLGNGHSYIKGILDIGDQIDHESTGFTMFSSNTHAVRLVVWFLRRIDNLEERGKLLLECFKASSGISIVEHILLGDENRREKSDADQILRDEEFDLIKVEFVRKLDEMSKNNSNELLSHEHLVSFLYRWKRWGDENKVTDWLKLQANTVEGCITLLKGFVGKSSSQAMGDYVVKVTTYIKLESIEDFLEIAPIEEKLRGIDESKFDSKEREALKAFQEALEKREKGISDYW